MFYVFYFAVFLASSVFAHSKTSESDGLQKFEEPTAILEELVMKVNENVTWKFPDKCCMCKESVMLARFLVMNEIQQKAENICNLMKSVRNQCMTKAKTYQNIIVRTLFPGGPQGICKSLKICK